MYDVMPGGCRHSRIFLTQCRALVLLSYQNVQHANYYWNTEANANHFLVSFLLHY